MAMGKIGTWALELEDVWAKEGEGVGRTDGFLSSYKGREYQVLPPTSLKTRLFPRGRAKQHGWITQTRIDENPVIRGHDL